MDNKSKLVWITGASSGIGEELCYKFANKNWKIAITARRKDRLLEIHNLIGKDNYVVPANVINKGEVKSAFNNFYKISKRIGCNT